jgi:predicted SPOUT superfamily RNA methylase MTH1
MLDAVWVRITARLRQHKIEQEEYWGEYRGFRQPSTSELAEIVRKVSYLCFLFT